MARILVVTSHPHFAEGGHLVIADALVQELRSRGHAAEQVRSPQNRFGRQASAYLATWLTDVGMAHDGRPIDQVISLRFPSYAVRHQRHVCWLNHTMREYYDRWEDFASGLGRRGRLKEGLRRAAVRQADRYLLGRRVTRLFVQSRTVGARLQRFLGIEGEVLHPPAPPRPYRCDDYGDYLFVVSRHTPLKRIDLVIRALAEPPARGIKCVIAGAGESADALAELVQRLDLSREVTLAGHVTNDELVGHLARCRAVCFTPLDEDYGFVTLEAFSAAKPVVTCLDSGGPAELVQDGVNGLVCEATPAALAAAIRRIVDDRALAEQLGTAGARIAAGITWSGVVERLLLV